MNLDEQKARINAPESSNLKFCSLQWEESGWYAIFVNGNDIKFKATPIDMTFKGHTYVDLVGHIRRQQKFSEKTFGPFNQGPRLLGVIDHITKELGEIRQDPKDLNEWIDIIILGIDGASRAGHSPEAIVEALVAKQTKNENRQWPDWRKADPTKAIEHVRTPEEEAIKAQELATNQAELNFDANGTQVTE